MEDKITVLMSGLPGNMATAAAEKIMKQEDMRLHGSALTGEIKEDIFRIGDKGEIFLIKPINHDDFLTNWINYSRSNLIIVDYSQPDAVNKNAELYCKHKIPFVMGTTGGDRKKLEETVRNSEISAVIAPNMAKQIVALQAFMDEYSKNNYDSLKGYEMEIIESHQQGKKDTSGTAKAMVSYFNRLGIDFKPEQIKMIRDPEEQLKFGVPKEHLEGHGWHTYIISSKNSEQSIANLSIGLMNFLEHDKVFKDYRFPIANPYLDGISVNPNYFKQLKSEDVIEFSLQIAKDRNSSFSAERFENNMLALYHNINGREIYAEGTLDPIRFLSKKFYHEGNKGNVYSRIDVLNEGK